ncbi:hypothetical protein BKI52_35125 [marine bacterium AO1-C]|nr:hypothetical protein BKI52_35125 [marine bacterium AO1-C]
MLIASCVLFLTMTTYAQQTEVPEKRKLKSPLSRLWINTYGNVRLSKKFFWVAQTHFRFQESSSTKFAGQVAQVYNRHALSYFYSKKFRVSLGGVLRLNFNTDDIPAEEQAMVPEWRIWHEYLFALPLSRLMVYHRLRVEHRWTRKFQKDSPFIFRNRWRYMFNVKIPINKPKLAPGAFYIAPEAELIMQSGKSIIESPMEDLRLHTSFGYILKPQLTVAAGLMYSTGQELTDGALYNQKWTLRLHVYFSPDFRKLENRLPAVN